MPAGLGAWNSDAGAAWNRLRTSLSRVSDLEYFRAVEVQRRGALHLHVIVWSAEPLDVGQVQELALAAGFGCVLDLVPLQPRHHRYVAKYATKGADLRGGVPWARVVDQTVNRWTGEVEDLVSHDATFRTWSSSRGWGVTIAAIRADRRAKINAGVAQARAATICGVLPRSVVESPHDEPGPAPPRDDGALRPVGGSGGPAPR